MNRSQKSKNQFDRFYSEGEVLYAEKTKLKSRNKSIVKTFTVFFALLIACLLLYFASRALFGVKEFKVEGNSYYTSEKIIEACGIDNGQFMFSFSALDIETKIKQKCPYVKEVTLKRNYPSAIHIEVEEYTAQFYTVAVDKYIIVSPSLKVLEVAEEKSNSGELIYLELPEISVAIEGREFSFKEENSTDYILKTVNSLSEYTASYKITKISLTESYSIKLYCGEGYEVLLGKPEEMELKLETLSLILASDKLSGIEYARIDMTNPKQASFVPIEKE